MHRRLAVSLLLGPCAAPEFLSAYRWTVSGRPCGFALSARLSDSGVWRADKRIAKGRFKSPRRGIPLNIPALA